MLRRCLTWLRDNFHPLWRLRKFAWYRRLQKAIDFPVTHRLGGIRYSVMLLRDFSLLVPRAGDELRTHMVFEKILRHGAITHLFDVGANVGLFTWHALGVTPSLNVSLFEPDATNVRLLKKTITTNRLNRVSIWEGIAGAATGEVEFLVDEASGTTGSIRDCQHRSETHLLPAV